MPAEDIDPVKPSVYNNLNSTSQEVAAFLAAIAAAPDDDTNRLVFADWLRDHMPDQTELIDLYAGGARRWMEEFVKGEQTCTNYSVASEANSEHYRAERENRAPELELVDFDYVPVTVEDMLRAGRDFLETEGNSWFVQTGEEGLRNKMYEDGNVDMFWRCGSVLAGIAVDPNSRKEFGNWSMSPVSCTC